MCMHIVVLSYFIIVSLPRKVFSKKKIYQIHIQHDTYLTETLPKKKSLVSVAEAVLFCKFTHRLCYFKKHQLLLSLLKIHFIN